MSVLSSLIDDDTDPDPGQIFETEDYYIASHLEGLVVVFENLFKEWRPLIEGRISRRTIISREEISVEVEIIIPGTTEADPDHPIALLDLPIHISLVPRITSSVGSQARYVLSAASMAAFSVGIDVPFLAECEDSFWIGRSLSSRYQVEVMDLDIPDRFTNLSGIVSIFHDLTERSPPEQLPTITVEYLYNDLQFDISSIMEHLQTRKDSINSPLKWGCSSRTRLLMQLRVRWTPFPEGTFLGNSLFTDLNPEAAPIWELDCQMAPDSRFRLISALKRFLSACAILSESATMEDISRRDHGFIPSYSIQELARSAFRIEDRVQYSARIGLPTKSCPFQSLLSNLVLCMMEQPNHEPYKIAQLYLAFVSELQRHWDEGIPLPGLLSDIESPIPDLNSCLLYQKLQVLDHCIKLRIVASDRPAQLISPVIERAKHWADYDYDDFDDCTETSHQVADRSIYEDQISEAAPEGINYDIVLPQVLLLNGKSQMHVPITLESPLMTEDEIEKQHEMLASLGTDNESTTVRAELQASSLLSDMSAFKAANPGAELGDFVRWYSPNDWIEGKGLSKRMAGSDNLWKRCWSKAPSLPASRQRPLFDCIAQGERILDWFRTITPSALMEQISAIAISNAASVIAATFSTLDHLPFAKSFIEMMFQKADHATILTRIEETEIFAELVARLDGSVLKPSEIDDITRRGTALIGSDRERIISLFSERFRLLVQPDQQCYTVSGKSSQGGGLYAAVQLDGGALVTADHGSGPSQVIFCSALPIG